MKRTLCHPFAIVGPVSCLTAWALISSPSLSAQSGAPNGEWRTYGGDLGNTRYSPLDQINAANFKSLEVAWRFKTDNLGPQPEFNLESTPLSYFVGGTDFHLTAGATEAIDKGVSVAEAGVDIDGQTHDVGSAPDLGADEH